MSRPARSLGPASGPPPFPPLSHLQRGPARSGSSPTWRRWHEYGVAYVVPWPRRNRPDQPEQIGMGTPPWTPDVILLLFPVVNEVLCPSRCARQPLCFTTIDAPLSSSPPAGNINGNHVHTAVNSTSCAESCVALAKPRACGEKYLTGESTSRHL